MTESGDQTDPSPARHLDGNAAAGNPEHMRSNAEVDFVISEADMTTLRDLRAQDYGEHSVFPVYSGK